MIPCCDGTEPRVVECGVIVRSYRVMCPRCWFMGPVRATPVKAEQAWDRRLTNGR